MYALNTVLSPNQTEKVYCLLDHSDEVTRPGAIKLADHKWQPAAIELVLVRGYVRGIKSITVLQDKIYPTIKAASKVARKSFQ